MVRGLYTSATGMVVRIREQDIIANNLANAATDGFKKSGLFASELQCDLVWDVTRPLSDGPLGPISRGVRTSGQWVDFSRGPARETGEPLDCSMDGDGFFTVLKDGQLYYTRNGSFTLGPGGYIMTKDGGYLMGRRGPIQLSEGPVTISEDGRIVQRVTTQGPDGVPIETDRFVDELALVDFDDRGLLVPIGDSLWANGGAQVRDLYGDPSAGRVVQGTLEGSNVDVVREIVDMITCFRAYESSQRMLIAQDSTLEKAVNEVGRLG